jgi:hypothetical protein
MIYYSKTKAKELGATHRAWMHGIIPGYFNPETNHWVPLSDWLNPIEDGLTGMWVFMRQMRGEEPDFMFSIGGEL